MKRTVVIALVVVFVSIPLVAPAAPVGKAAEKLIRSAPKIMKLVKSVPTKNAAPKVDFEVLTGKLKVSRPASRPLWKRKGGEVGWGDKIEINFYKEAIRATTTIGACEAIECVERMRKDNK